MECVFKTLRENYFPPRTLHLGELLFECKQHRTVRLARSQKMSLKCTLPQEIIPEDVLYPKQEVKRGKYGFSIQRIYVEKKQREFHRMMKGDPRMKSVGQVQCTAGGDLSTKTNGLRQYVSQTKKKLTDSLMNLKVLRKDSGKKKKKRLLVKSLDVNQCSIHRKQSIFHSLLYGSAVNYLYTIIIM